MRKLGWAGLEVLEVVVEGRTLVSVGGSTSSFNILGHARWTTGEHTDLGQQEVLLLEAVEESVEVWSSEVSHRAQSSEQTLARDLLEMTLTDVQHGGPEVKFVKELGDEDVDLHKIFCVLLLNLTDDVGQPLKLMLSTSDPDEVNLFALNTTTN